MKVTFFTLGCKVNQYETDIMKKKFEDAGYTVLENKEKADIYVVNSCSVTNLSTRKTRQFLSKAKKLGGIVILVGCYAQEIKDKCESLKNVDIILGNEQKQDVVKYLREYLKEDEKKLYYNISNIEDAKKYQQSISLEKGFQIRESVKIEDGCNNFCSYCIIPYVRGRVRSRSLDSIINEVENLVKNGVGEIILVGIEIASYGTDLSSSSFENISLIDVIENVARVSGLKQLRLGSLEPRVLTDEFIQRCSKLKNLCPHFHISIQSLDDNVLARMNRKYNGDFVMDKIATLRKYIKDVAITCDIIVGFPGETDEEFNNTLNRVKKIGLYEMHVFKYSKRKWTRAQNMECQVDGNIASYRSETLISVGNMCKAEFLNKYIGKKMSVLFESYSAGYLYGYTPNYIKVKVRGDKKLWGCQLEVELISIENEVILGNICQ